MNLSKKTLLYSSILSILIVSLMIGYFIFMLPSLYVAYRMDQNYESVVKLQRSYLKTGSYDSLPVSNPVTALTVDIPLSDNTVSVLNKFFRITVTVRDSKIINLLDDLRYYATHEEELKNIGEADFNLDEIVEELQESSDLSEDDFLDFEYSLYDNDVFQELSSTFHTVSDRLMIYESNVTDGSNYYTAYLALGVTERSLAITFFSVMTPRIEDIKPVIFQSLPMIAAVSLLLVLLSSQVFSRMIILPVIKLAKHAQYMREAEGLKLEPIAVTGHDEISSLGESLNQLYQKIQESYRELEDKNQALAEENKRQEVFLRASSHQLKTPIAAAKLLVEGMMGEVGKYKDVKAYLPQVKEQLGSMQKIVEDILYLNHFSRELAPELLPLSEVMEECLASYQVQLEEKALTLQTEGRAPVLETDRELLRIILDNLLSNAVHYTPEGDRIRISYEEHRLCITNYGAAIDDELLPHVFEPFVTGENMLRRNPSSPVAGDKANGLGLYIASYYAKLLHYRIRLQNIEDGVTAELYFM